MAASSGKRDVRVRRNHPQGGLHDRHDQGRRHAFARHVGERDGRAVAGQIQKVVVVAADDAGGEAEGGKRDDRRFERMARDEALLHLRRQCEIALEAFVLDDAGGQAGVLQHEGEMIRAVAQQAFLEVRESAGGGLSQQQHSHHFLIGAERNREARPGLSQRLDFGEVLRLEFLGPSAPDVEIGGADRQRRGMKAKAVRQKAVAGNGAGGRSWSGTA